MHDVGRWSARVNACRIVFKIGQPSRLIPISSAQLVDVDASRVGRERSFALVDETSYKGGLAITAIEASTHSMPTVLGFSYCVTAEDPPPVM